MHQYLTEYRIGKAAALLRAGCSVTDVCYRVGFSDCSGFIRLFKKKERSPPTNTSKMPAHSPKGNKSSRFNRDDGFSIDSR